MMDRFLQADFEQYLYLIYHNRIQGQRTVAEYTTEFLCLAECNSLDEIDSQQVERYINVLRLSIQDRIGLQIFQTVQEVNSMTLKVELTEN